MRTTDPYSPTARAKASPAPASTDGRMLGQDHAAEHLAPGGAEGGGGLLGLRIELGQHRLDAADAEGQRHEEPARQAMPRRVPARSTWNGLLGP